MKGGLKMKYKPITTGGDVVTVKRSGMLKSVGKPKMAMLKMKKAMVSKSI